MRVFVGIEIQMFEYSRLQSGPFSLLNESSFCIQPRCKSNKSFKRVLTNKLLSLTYQTVEMDVRQSEHELD